MMSRSIEGSSRVSDYQPRSQAGWPEQPPASGQQSSGYGEPPPPGRSRPRRRRHRGRWLGITLIVLIGLLIAADFGAKAYAENAIASKIDSSGLGVKPSVTIEGFPFLTQVAARDLKQID